MKTYPRFDSVLSRAIMMTLLTTVMLSACGQKGALYLPDNNSGIVVSPQAMPPTDSTQPTISNNPQNPNVISTKPNDPATTDQSDLGNNAGTKNDY